MPIPRDQLLDYFARLEERYRTLEEEIAKEASAGGDPKAYQSLSKELSELLNLLGPYRAYLRTGKQIVEAESFMENQEEAGMYDLAKEELDRLRRQGEGLIAELERIWLQRHQEPERQIIVEIRAGTGGLEASLFVADLYRMYIKYATACNLAVEQMHGAPSEAGGLKEIAFSVRGPGAWKNFKFESGVHRVQRVPITEAQGRIHTSAATVAVLPEPQDLELPPIPAKDLQIDVYRSSGPGGQGVNTTDSAVRVRHLPTGIMVTCQDERSQLRNKEKAMRVLRARLLDEIQRSQRKQIASDRRRQVGTGDRSEKIRTYNFPDHRVTDHRIGLTLHKLDAILGGDLKELVEALSSEERSRQLNAE